MKVLRNGYFKGCSRQAIKGEIVKSFGKEISNHVFNRALKDAIDGGLAKTGATSARFKLTAEGYVSLIPPKPVKKKGKEGGKENYEEGSKENYKEEECIEEEKDIEEKCAEEEEKDSREEGKQEAKQENQKGLKEEGNAQKKGGQEEK